jgi:glycosyltransferase involved in cell wall biosynthesis
VIASYLGARALAQFAAISYITLIGHLVVNATSQAALPLLARDAQASDPQYRTRLGGLVAGTLAGGALCLLAAFAFGRPTLAFIYGREYAEHDDVLLWLVLAMIMTFTSVFLGTGTMARQRFAPQWVISATSLAVVAGCIFPFVRGYGLRGAAWSLLAGAAVELAGYAVLTAHDLRIAARASSASIPPTARALRVLNVLGRLERGGAELRMVELAEAFPPERVRSDFLVLTGLDGTLDDRVKTAGSRVIKCRLGVGFPLAFLRVLRQERYDVVHSHVHYFSGVILLLARLAGVPGRVSHLHTARVNDRDETRRRRIQLSVCRTLIDWNATNIVAAGEGAMAAAWGPGWRADGRCSVVYNTIRGDRLRAGVESRLERPTIVNVASVKPLKNQLRLVAVLGCLVAKMPEVQLRLIGKEEGDYGQRVRRAATAAGLEAHVSFVGEVDEAMPWLASAHLMILPSVWEGLPCAVLEACAVGTPVLASDLPGTREIARHFPHLHLLSLEDDETWAAAAAHIIQQGAPDPAEAAERLERSPFVFDRSCLAHFEIWSRLRASA